jgi:hypothetical protein
VKVSKPSAVVFVIATAAVAVVIAPFVWAAHELATDEEKAPSPPPAEKAASLTLPAGVVRLEAGRYCEGDPVDLLIVYPKNTETGTFTTTRANGWFGQNINQSTRGDISVTVKRGTDDQDATSVAIALANPHDVYLFSEKAAAPCKRSN